MMIDADSPLNAGVLRYLGRTGKEGAQLLASPGSVKDPYMCQGSHPDIVSRVWDEIGGGLRGKCRCLIHGTPAIIQPKSGVVLAICNGTQYNLRLTAEDFRDAIAKGASTRTRWSSGQEMDSTVELGSDWIFGSWSADEPTWCRRAYEQHTP